MGNRAVITTREAFENNGVGVYLHWNGGRDSVTAFLTYCKFKGYRSPKCDESYAWARFCQVVSNFFGGSTSIGVNVVNRLDCDNYDNGVYIVDDWEIVGREFFKWEEQNEYSLLDMLIAIDEAQPDKERIGKEEISNKLIELPIDIPTENSDEPLNVLDLMGVMM